MYHAKKRWVYPETDAAAIEQLQTELNISEQLATLLTQRGHRDVEAAKAFLYVEDELTFLSLIHISEPTRRS